MKTFTLEVDIASDGSLQVDIPAGLPPGKAELLLVVQPLAKTSLPYRSLAGIWTDCFPYDFDMERTLREIRHEWENEGNQKP